MRHGLFSLLGSLVLVGGSVLAAAGPAAASTAPPSARASTGTGASTGEAGYVATGNTGAYTEVSSDWVEPTAHCASGDQYAAFWVGLDGFSDSTVEQAGTEADCAGSTAEYFAWYEFYPESEVTLSNPVKAGDDMAASITYAGSSKFTVKIADTTQGWSHTGTVSFADAERSSAEIMVTAPTSTGVLPITNFGKVTYTAAMVNKAGLCKSDAKAVTSPGLTVSGITGCTSFTVTQTQTHNEAK